jgi:hypothetical protein
MCSERTYDPEVVYEFLLDKAGVEDDPRILEIMREIDFRFDDGFVCERVGSPNRSITRPMGPPKGHFTFKEMKDALSGWEINESKEGFVASAPIDLPGPFNCHVKLPNIKVFDGWHDWRSIDNPNHHGFPEGYFVVPGCDIDEGDLRTTKLICDSSGVLFRGIR